MLQKLTATILVHDYELDEVEAILVINVLATPSDIENRHISLVNSVFPEYSAGYDFIVVGVNKGHGENRIVELHNEWNVIPADGVYLISPEWELETG